MHVLHDIEKKWHWARTMALHIMTTPSVLRIRFALPRTINVFAVQDAPLAWSPIHAPCCLPPCAPWPFSDTI